MKINQKFLREPLARCGGCGSNWITIELVTDKKGNHGYLCKSCRSEYTVLLTPESIRCFWMCGACGFRILAGTQIDAEVDYNMNKCPNCGMDVNFTLINLKDDQIIESGAFGEPIE